MVRQLFEARRNATRRRNPRWHRWITGWLRGRAAGSFRIDTFAAGFEPLEGRAVLAVNSITALNTVFTEDFNSMGSSATATMPSGFRMGTDYTTGASATTQAAGTSGTGVVTGTSSGGFYNWASGVTGTSTDRAIGFLTSSGYTAPRSIIAAFTNATGTTIDSITVGWNFEKYRSGTRAFDWTFFHGSTSTATTAATSGNQSYVADANNTTVSNPPASVAKSVSLSGLGIAAGSTYYLRWTYTGVAGSTNSQGLGIDDVTITAASATTPAITIGGGTSATAAAFTTTYGTASAAQTFEIAGSNLTDAIAVAAVTGFEFSTDGSTWGSTASFAPSGGVVSGTLHVRLAATAGFGGTYDGRSITLSSAGATARTILTAASGNAVAAQSLTITGLAAENKNWDGTTAVVVTGTPAYAGLVNGESFTVTGTVTWAFADAAAGADKSLVRTGSYAAPSANYTVTQPALTASIVAVVPSAPTITGIVAGDGRLTVAFTPPASTGGAAITNYKYSTDGGATFTALSPAATVSPIVITGLTNDAAYDVQILAVNAAGDGAASATVTATPSASIPTLVVSATEFAAAFSTSYGTASAEQSFTVSGTSLTGDVTVTAPDGFEVSTTSGAGFGSTATIAPESGVVVGTTVFLRLRDRAAAGTYDGRGVTIASAGAVTRTISTTASGNAVATATLTVTGAAAESKTYDGTTAAAITGAALVGVLAGDDVTIASSGGTFASANVGTGITVTGALVLGGTAAANYTVVQPTGLAADIAQATQAITFPALPTDKKVGDAAFPAGATTSAPSAAGLTIAYASSNPAVATVAANGTITLVAPGVTTITASQTGSANVTAAASVSRTLQVGVASSSSQSTTLGWNLTTDANPSSGVVTGLAVSAISQGNSNGATTMLSATSPSSGYTGASGGNNAGVAARAGALSTAADGSAYFQFTLTPSAGTSFTIAALSFGYRSTGSGPTAYTVRSSADNFASDLATGTFLTNSTWALKSNTGLAIAGSAATTFRLYGFGSTGTPSAGTVNWRIDDLAVAITVTSGTATPAITPSGTAAGVSTTYGLASTASQFIVSGGGLTADITATAPTGFEVSSDGATFAGTATIPQSGGFADGVVFVRLAASAPAGTYASSVVTLSSAGAASRTVAIGSSSVAKAALVITAADVVTTVGSVPPTGPGSTAFSTTGLVGGQTVGSVTIAITQGTATAGTFPGAVVPSAATGGTFDPANYDVSYTAGALVVTESSPITVTGAFSALTTTYGTASSITTVGVSAAGLTGPITATAPAGFEVSSDGATFGATATFAAIDGVVAGTLTLRLKATASAGSQTGGVGLASPGVAFVTVPVPASTVNAKGLTIAGLVAQDKDFDGTTTAVVVGTPSYVGLVNGESFAVTGVVTWAFPDAAAGTGKTLVQTGAYAAPSANYTVTQPTLTATIRPAASVTVFSEDFASITTGNNTSTSGSSTAWSGSANWSSVTSAWQAGGAVRLGSGSTTGSITTKALNLTGNGGVFTVSFAVKGWTTVEGNISVTVTGLAAQTVTYTATISAAFQTRTLQFTGGQANSTITFATTAGRAFLEDIVVTSGTPTPVTTGIGGFVWNDADGDGVWDQPDEVGIAGRTVYLDLDRDGAVGTGEPTTVTGVDGSYEFTGLAAGTYIVAQVVPAGWQQTSPAIVAAQIRSVAGTGVQVATFTDPAYMPAERQQERRFVPNDPLFAQQWHLQNTGQRSGTAGEDARVVNAWDVAKGTGVVIGIVDDGLERTHPDLSPAYRADLSYDFNGNDADPMPGTGDDHGTAAAGVAAARGNNTIGVSGSAPGASLAGIRLISLATTDQQEANGLTYKPQDIAIYSNSWGPNDDGLTLEAPGPLTRAALANAVQTGRGGKGSIYVWAAGNGLAANDNSNYDGYANSRYTIAVTAVDNRGKQSWYAEPGANILVAAPSSGDSSGTDVGIVTVDRAGSNGYNVSATASPGNLSDLNYTNDFGGTSSATPLVSGVVALMLEANPNLGWRDVQHVLAKSARRNDVTDAGWSQNAAGLWVNHKYGFGVVDAAAAVNLAKTWTNVGAETSATSGTITVGGAIPDNNATGLTSTYTLGADIRMESVEVVFSANHVSRGHLQVVLTSPSGTKSVLAEKHADTGDNYSAWVFSTVRNWGESSKGTWSLTVSDLTSGTTGTFGSWALNVYGTALPAPAGTQTVTVTTGQVISGINFGTRSLLAAIATDGTLVGVSTTYGTASGTSSITVSGVNLAAGITATAPAGFQVSVDGTTFGTTALLPQSGGTAGGTLYVRLAAATAAGTYSGDVMLSSGATSVVAAMPSSVVSAKALTITGLSAVSREYDGTTAVALAGTAAYAGLVNGESFTVAGSPTAAFADANVGTGKAVTVSGFAAPSGNYTVSQPTGLTAAITAKDLTVAGVTATSREYDRTVTAALDVAAAAYVGLVTGESFAVAGTPIAAFADKNVGTGKAVTVSGFAAPNGNYTVSQPTGLTAAITAKALAITGATATSREYDGTTAVAVTGGALSGAIVDDDVAIGGSPTGTLADKNAGTGKGVSVSGFALLGADAGNYSLSQPTGLTANVTPKTLTVTANNRARVYGAGNPSLTAAIAGFVAGETQATALTGAPRVTTSATASSPVGAYALVPEVFTLAATNGNYSFQFVNGTLTVNKANLQVVLENKVKVAGQGDPAFTYGVLGLVNGDSAAGVLQGAASRTAGESAGNYTISKGTLALQSGGAAGNYNTPTFTNGTLTVLAAPKPLAVTGAFAKGNSWAANYLALPSFATASGGTRLGWALGDGASQLANSKLVTWSNVDRISVRFSEAITNPGTNSLSLLAITGTGAGTQSTITASAAPVLSEGNTVATWTVTSLATGKYTLVLKSTSFTSVATGGQLDGEWTTSSSTFAAGSGNGTAGGDFRLRFNVLVGDVNASGTVVNTDYTAVTTNINASVTTSNFRSDTNGSGTIVGTDATAVSALIGKNLPTGAEAPVVTAAAGATVDAAFDLSFTDDTAWRAAITGVRVGATAASATAIPGAAWAVATGKLTLDPAQATQLQTSGNRVVVIAATGYADVAVTQALTAGVATKLGIATQPTGPATNGGTLATAPVVRIQDQYGNTVTTSTALIAAAVEAGTGDWTLGGTLSRNASAGSATFSGLTATRNSGTVSGARIRFTSGSLTLVVSNGFAVP